MVTKSFDDFLEQFNLEDQDKLWREEIDSVIQGYSYTTEDLDSIVRDRLTQISFGVGTDYSKNIPAHKIFGTLTGIIAEGYCKRNPGKVFDFDAYGKECVPKKALWGPSIQIPFLFREARALYTPVSIEVSTPGIRCAEYAEGIVLRCDMAGLGLFLQAKDCTAYIKKRLISKSKKHCSKDKRRQRASQYSLNRSPSLGNIHHTRRQSKI